MLQYVCIRGQTKFIMLLNQQTRDLKYAAFFTGSVVIWTERQTILTVSPCTSFLVLALNHSPVFYNRWNWLRFNHICHQILPYTFQPPVITWLMSCTHKQVPFTDEEQGMQLKSLEKSVNGPSVELCCYTVGKICSAENYPPYRLSWLFVWTRLLLPVLCCEAVIYLWALNQNTTFSNETEKEIVIIQMCMLCFTVESLQCLE